jgi:hypothetical protein
MRGFDRRKARQIARNRSIFSRRRSDNVKMNLSLIKIFEMLEMVSARWRSGYAGTVQGPKAWFKSKPGLQFPLFFANCAALQFPDFKCQNSIAVIARLDRAIQ